MKVVIPPLSRVKRKLPAGAPVDLPATIQREWQQLNLAEQVSGKSIAIGVGSRGIANLQEIILQIVTLVRESGGKPFIVPAMGSHGGATPEGQTEVLAGLGITEDSVECAIRATMRTVLIGHTENGHPAYLDRNVAEADGFFIINRVKPHTDFHAKHESGLLKMLAIGLGKEDGASFMHSTGTQGLKTYMPEVGAYLLEHTNLIAGLATVEDGYHQPVHLRVLTPDALISGELELLDKARQLMPRLPVDEIDLLIVDRLGKDISGTGMDTNVIGRIYIPGEAEPESPNVKALIILDVSEASHGNAIGVGLADFTVERLLKKIDFPQMTKNVFTSGFLERGRIPLVFQTDEAAIEAALRHVFRANIDLIQQARVMRISDTLNLEQVWVSQALLDEVQSSEGFLETAPPEPLIFHDGHLF